jgi:hypothetical protein
MVNTHKKVNSINNMRKSAAPTRSRKTNNRTNKGFGIISAHGQVAVDGARTVRERLPQGTSITFTSGIGTCTIGTANKSKLAKAVHESDDFSTLLQKYNNLTHGRYSKAFSGYTYKDADNYPNLELYKNVDGIVSHIKRNGAYVAMAHPLVVKNNRVLRLSDILHEHTDYIVPVCRGFPPNAAINHLNLMQVVEKNGAARFIVKRLGNVPINNTNMLQRMRRARQDLGPHALIHARNAERKRKANSRGEWFTPTLIYP